MFTPPPSDLRNMSPWRSVVTKEINEYIASSSVLYQWRHQQCLVDCQRILWSKFHYSTFAAKMNTSVRCYSNRPPCSSFQTKIHSRSTLPTLCSCMCCDFYDIRQTSDNDPWVSSGILACPIAGDSIWIIVWFGNILYDVIGGITPEMRLNTDNCSMNSAITVQHDLIIFQQVLNRSSKNLCTVTNVEGLSQRPQTKHTRKMCWNAIIAHNRPSAMG